MTIEREEYYMLLYSKASGWWNENGHRHRNSEDWTVIDRLYKEITSLADEDYTFDDNPRSA